MQYTFLQHFRCCCYILNVCPKLQLFQHMDFEQGYPLTIFRRVFTISHRNAFFRSSPTATLCSPRSAPRTTSRRCTRRPTGASRRTPSGRSSPGTSTSEQVGRIGQHYGGEMQKQIFPPPLLESQNISTLHSSEC